MLLDFAQTRTWARQEGRQEGCGLFTTTPSVQPKTPWEWWTRISQRAQGEGQKDLSHAQARLSVSTAFQNSLRQLLKPNRPVLRIEFSVNQVAQKTFVSFRQSRTEQAWAPLPVTPQTRQRKRRNRTVKRPAKQKVTDQLQPAPSHRKHQPIRRQPV